MPTRCPTRRWTPSRRRSSIGTSNGIRFSRRTSGFTAAITSCRKARPTRNSRNAPGSSNTCDASRRSTGRASLRASASTGASCGTPSGSGFSGPRNSASGSRCRKAPRPWETRSSRSSCAPSRRCRVGSRASSDGSSVPPRSSRRRRAASVRPSRSGRKSPSRRRPGSPGASVEEAKEIVKSDHPTRFEEALAYTAKAMADAKAFIRQHDLATIPANEELTVIETPAYLRHVIPFAAYNSPARFESHKQGFYMVTPVEDKPEMLREHSYAGTRNTAVHEGYPGHHLQLTCATLNPSYARILADATETTEGWAHYCEDMMKREGFSADPKTKFVQLLDQIWRACRILIDVDLHTGKMTFDEAVDLLVREAGMERPGAVAEVKRYTYNPAYQLSYLIGKHP